MSTVLIDKHNRQFFTPYIADYIDLAGPDTIALGAVDSSGIAVGALVSSVIGSEVSIDWLYVDESSREQGYATNLVRTLASSSFRTMSKITAGFENDRALYMLFKRQGFTVSESEIPVYTFPLSGLSKNSFFSKGLESENVVPLSQIDPYTLRRFSAQLEKTNMPVELPIDAKLYEPDASVAYVCGKEIKGVVLIACAKSIEVVFAYAAPGEKTALPSMLISAGRTLLDKYPHDTSVTVATVRNISAAIAEKLFPEVNKTSGYSAELRFR